MKKRIISLFLVLAMLLSTVPAVAASEPVADNPKFTTRSLILHKSISINFKVPYADVENNFTKVEFLKDGEVVQAYNTLPEEDADGFAAFEFTKLSPRELGKEITGRVYDRSGDYTEVTTTVLSYCNAVLADANSDPDLKTLVVDLLNYGAAFQTFKQDDTTLANAGLTSEQQALATPFATVETHKNISSEIANPAAVWNSATLLLEDSIIVGFWFKAENADGWSATVDFNGNSWEIDDIEYDFGKQLYKFYFDKLTPSQLSDKMTVVIKDSEGQAVSNTLTYSVESYAYDVINSDQTSDTLKELVKKIMCYGNSAGVLWSNDTSSPVTRADMEAALAEVAWDFYMKDIWMQYDSTDLNGRGESGTDTPLSRWMGGFTRLGTYLSTMEDATSDDTLYSVCSYFVWAVYYEALGYPLFGNSLNASTSNLWWYAEKPQDMLVISHHNWPENTNIDSREEGYVTHSKCVTYDELDAFLRNWDENLRPGDIIKVISGHTAIYVGNGWILDSNGYKYNMASGKDVVEADGTIDAWTVEDYFFSSNSDYNLSRLQTENKTVLTVLRPLDLLTADDSDNDPSNDILDETFEMDIGRLNLQFDNDPNTILKTSGFTVQDSAVSRMEYPAMNIDRTVNITPYGTAVKGDTVTYTISISNESNNANYIAYRSVGSNTPYVGENYVGLSIEEKVPANTTLVSAPGAVVNGSILQWEIDVPVGQTVAVSYTVQVTGEIGDKIINGDGWVENIPSNTITNTIGGSKLTDAAVAGLQEFYRAGTSTWNSNDGYKISAAADENTNFAVRVYNEALGMDLELPDVQTLFDNLFTQILHTETSGMYAKYDTSVSRYMYTLNNQTPDPDQQIYRNMLVDGCFGGVWVYSNMYTGNKRIDEPRTDYLEPGDILVYMNLTESASDGTAQENRTVAHWQVLVYMGDNCFASLDSNSKMRAIGDNSAFLPALAFDAFVVLRPSQAYVDINTEVSAYTDQAEDLTEADAATKYVPNISNILLGDTLSAKLAALTENEGWTEHNAHFVGEVYSKLGIPEPSSGFWDAATYAGFVKALFNDDTSSESEAFEIYQHEYYIVEEPFGDSVTMYDMLTHYDGPAYVDKKAISSLSELHPGDVVLLGIRRESHYICAIYQGNGKFLTARQSRAGMFQAPSSWSSITVSSDAELHNWLYGPIDTTVDATLGYEGYLILRPSRVYDNINLIPRDIAEGVLTQEEKDALAALTPDDWKADGGAKINQLHHAAGWFYDTSINVSVSSYINGKTIAGGRNALFAENKDLDPSKWEYNPSDANYEKMLVDGYYGGWWFVDGISKTFTASDFQIGDIFCGCRQSDSAYWTALYQGNGTFLVVQNISSTSTVTCFTDSEAIFSDNIVEEWKFYYVLRPEQLAQTEGSETPDEPEVPDDPETPGEPAELRDITTGALTEAEKAALAALTADDWTAAGGSTLNQLKNAVPWMYAAIGVDVASYINEKTIAGGRNALFAQDTTTTKWYYNPSDTNYAKMLVDDWYGGDTYFGEGKSKVFSNSEFKVGDIFCGYHADGYYWTALYQGDTFLVVKNVSSSSTVTCFKDSETIFSDNIAADWKFYYVLRPEQLAESETPEEPAEPRDIATGALTDAEKAALAALTADDWSTAGGSNINQLHNVAKWAYGAINVDIGEYIGSLTIAGGRDALFDKTTQDGKEYFCRKTAVANQSYEKMLVVGSFGGSRVIDGRTSAFTADNFEIGDIFCACKVSEGVTTYWTALYQGNGSFLVVQNIKDGAVTCITDTSVIFNNATGSYWRFYYVLRPNNLSTGE